MINTAGRQEELDFNGFDSTQARRSFSRPQGLLGVFSPVHCLCVPSDPMDWNTGNVQKWLLWTEHLYRLPHAGKAFQDLTGKDLCNLSEEEFHQRSPQSGDTLHAHLDIWKSGV